MVFSRLFFIYLFFPICFLCYFATKKTSYRNAVLIVFSLLFYACGDLSFLWLVVASALVNFVLGRGIERFRDKTPAKLLLALGLVLNLGTLVGFKYTGFFIENLNHWFSLSIPVPDLPLPLGISFFTFRTVSYLIDCAWGKFKSERNFFTFLLYVSFFPITISGPIARYETMQAYLHQRRISADDISIGFGRIAVGLAGHGSECFGFDDDLSKDHDFGPAVCLWLTDDDYDSIGERLAAEYDKLPKSFLGVAARIETQNGHGRVGVIKLSDFLTEHIGCAAVPERTDLSEWQLITDNGAAAAVNGEIFRDASGIFTGERQRLLEYYPNELWYPKMAEAAVKIAQYGQYNYGRCIRRGDYVAASLAYAGFIEQTMKLCFLVYREYMPYYKWSYRALVKLAQLRQEPVLMRVCELLDELSQIDYHDEDKASECIENICMQLVRILNMQSLSGSNDYYMETQGYAIMQGYESVQTSLGRNEDNGSMAGIIERIVKLEWDMFQAAHNEGGRADCQNNYNTFTLMRRSQFMAWSDELCRSYLSDLEEGARTGRNLVTEKYARMMESTAPQEYESFKDSLPVIDDERRTIAEQVIAIQVGWLEEFVGKYPALAGQIRFIHTSEDTPFDTSAETYLRGELDTYSKDTFILYCRYVIGLYQNGKNLNEMIMENTVLQYGYESLEDAQRKLEAMNN